jgi:clan AA aspartic protease
MMTGRVNRKREPRLRISLRGPTGRRLMVSAVVDTGYDGFLCLPLRAVTRLELNWAGSGWATLANGAGSRFEYYLGEVQWDGTWRTIRISAAGPTPCIGMRLLNGFELQLQGRVGGPLVIQATQ